MIVRRAQTHQESGQAGLRLAAGLVRLASGFAVDFAAGLDAVLVPDEDALVSLAASLPPPFCRSTLRCRAASRSSTSASSPVLLSSWANASPPSSLASISCS